MTVSNRHLELCQKWHLLPNALRLYVYTSSLVWY